MKIIRSSVGSLASLGLIRELQSWAIEVIGIDSNPNSFGLKILKKGYVVPLAIEKAKLKTSILNLISQEKPDAILPGHNGEMLVFSDIRSEIELSGTKLLCSHDHILKIVSDKYLTSKFFISKMIPTPEIYPTKEGVKFPCIIKPRHGSGSRDVYKINNRKELDFYYSRVDYPVLQEYIDGIEYSVDVLSDKQGNILCMVPRERRKTSDGYSIISKTVENDMLLMYVAKIVKEIGLYGPSCIQCIIRNESDINFTEINNRFGGGAILSIKANKAFIPLLIDLIRGEKVSPELKYKKGLEMYRNYAEVFKNG